MLMSCYQQREMGHTNPDAGRISQVLERYVFRRYVVVDLRPERGTSCHIVLVCAHMADNPFSAGKSFRKTTLAL